MEQEELDDGSVEMPSAIVSSLTGKATRHLGQKGCGLTAIPFPKSRRRW
jgi:hypothetical protein